MSRRPVWTIDRSPVLFSQQWENNKELYSYIVKNKELYESMEGPLQIGK